MFCFIFVLRLILWLLKSFSLSWLLCKISRRWIYLHFSPDAILCGWLGSKHQVTKPILQLLFPFENWGWCVCLWRMEGLVRSYQGLRAKTISFAGTRGESFGRWKGDNFGTKKRENYFGLVPHKMYPWCRFMWERDRRNKVEKEACIFLVLNMSLLSISSFWPMYTSVFCS